MAKEDEEIKVTEGDQDLGETVKLEDEKPAAQKAAAPAEKDDEKLADGEGDEDARLADGSKSEEEIREARRKERLERKERQRRARERDDRELKFLRQRNEQLEKRQSQLEVQQYGTRAMTIDQQIQQLDGWIRQSNQVHADALAQNNSADAAEAQNIKDQLQQQRQQLLAAKAELAKRAQAVQQTAQQTAQQAPQGDQETAKRAEAWIRKNSWYDPNRGNEDSRIVSAIDVGLVEEGYDPATQDFWDELDDRVRERLPHRFASQNGHANQQPPSATQPPAQQRQRGPVMANAQRERSLRPGEMYVSPERVAALKELGAWDDPVLRTKYLKRYREYDRQAGKV